MQVPLEQLYHPLLSYVKKRINHKEDAEDITQEVFYKLSKSSHESVENIKSWVYTIARNIIIDYYRKNRVETVDIERSSVYEEDENDCSKELSVCIASYINILPEEYRTIMTLSELENTPQKEIAEQLTMNYVTVRSKIQRGRKKLKELFSECCTIIQGGKGRIIDYSSKEEWNSSNCGSCH